MVELEVYGCDFTYICSQNSGQNHKTTFQMKSCNESRKVWNKELKLRPYVASAARTMWEVERSDLVGWLSRYSPLGSRAGPPPPRHMTLQTPPLEKMKLTKVLELHLHCFAELPTCVKKSIGGGVSPYK